MASSKDIAAHFGKAHKDVLEAIKALISQEPSIERNFPPIEIDVKVGFGTRKSPAYLMDRDGFTGAKALSALFGEG